MSLLSMLRRRPVTLESVESLTPTVKLFRFRAADSIGYDPGQIAPLVVDTGDKKYVKPYSIASRPGDPSAVELCIKLVPEGRATPFLHDCQAGLEAKMVGPTGGLSARGADTTRLVFIATGTGIAPFRSIIWHLHEQGDARQIELVAGTRFDNELLFADEWRSLEADWPNFTYTPVVSRPGDGWDGAKGHVQDNLGDSYGDTTFFLCGLPAMVTDTKQALLDAGVSKKQIKAETFH